MRIADSAKLRLGIVGLMAGVTIDELSPEQKAPYLVLARRGHVWTCVDLVASRLVHVGFTDARVSWPALMLR